MHYPCWWELTSSKQVSRDCCLSGPPDTFFCMCMYIYIVRIVWQSVTRRRLIIVCTVCTTQVMWCVLPWCWHAGSVYCRPLRHTQTCTCVEFMYRVWPYVTSTYQCKCTHVWFYKYRISLPLPLPFSLVSMIHLLLHPFCLHFPYASNSLMCLCQQSTVGKKTDDGHIVVP